eukprot:gene9216-9383_t
MALLCFRLAWYTLQVRMAFSVALAFTVHAFQFWASIIWHMLKLAMYITVAMCPLAWPLMLFLTLLKCTNSTPISQQDTPQQPQVQEEDSSNDSGPDPSAAKEELKPSVAASSGKLVVHVMASCAVAAMDNHQPHQAAPVTAAPLKVEENWAALGRAAAEDVLEANSLVDEIFSVDQEANYMEHQAALNQLRDRSAGHCGLASGLKQQLLTDSEQRRLALAEKIEKNQATFMAKDAAERNIWYQEQWEDLELLAMVAELQALTSRLRKWEAAGSVLCVGATQQPKTDEGKVWALLLGAFEQAPFY